MSEHDEKRGGAGCVIGLVLVSLFLPVLYVLSIGPAAWLVKRTDAQWICAIYYPLGLLGEYCQPLNDALEWYMKLWMG